MEMRPLPDTFFPRFYPQGDSKAVIRVAEGYFGGMPTFSSSEPAFPGTSLRENDPAADPLTAPGPTAQKVPTMTPRFFRYLRLASGSAVVSEIAPERLFGLAVDLEHGCLAGIRSALQPPDGRERLSGQSRTRREN